MSNWETFDGGAFILAVLLGLILVAGVVGWVKNIIELTECDFKAPYKCEVIRAVGVMVPPVGAVVGFITIED